MEIGEKIKAGETRRDYRKEHNRRKETKKRFRVDMDIKRAEAFAEHLRASGLSFTKWVNNHIDSEMN